MLWWSRLVKVLLSNELLNQIKMSLIQVNQTPLFFGECFTPKLMCFMCFIKSFPNRASSFYLSYYDHNFHELRLFLNKIVSLLLLNKMSELRCTVRGKVMRVILSESKTHPENCLTVRGLLSLCILKMTWMCLEKENVPKHSEELVIVGLLHYEVNL